MAATVTKHRPGSSWRVKADDAPKPGSKMRGPAHHVGTLNILRNVPPDAWEGTCQRYPDTILDEVVIDHWFHLEQMGTRDYWMSIGSVVINVRVGKDGKAKTVVVDQDGRDEGCEVVGL